MRKPTIREALLEKEDADAITCRTCTAPAHDEFAPYCLSCGLYWQDVSSGLFDKEFDAELDAMVADHNRALPADQPSINLQIETFLKQRAL